MGASGFQRVSGMDADSTGVLYATGLEPHTGGQALITLDQRTGKGRKVSAIGVTGPITDLSFRGADGTLFAYSASASDHMLITINHVTGETTLLGSTGVSRSGGNAMAFDPSDTLLHSTQVSEINILNQHTGRATFVLDLSFPAPADGNPRINAMDFQPQTDILFASVNDGSDDVPENYLATVDRVTGEVTILGRTVDGLDALAWVSVR